MKPKNNLRGKYRCSACNELKNAKTNIVMREWDSGDPEYCDTTVGICRKCNLAMKRMGVKGVCLFNYKRDKLK